MTRDASGRRPRRPRCQRALPRRPRCQPTAGDSDGAALLMWREWAVRKFASGDSGGCPGGIGLLPGPAQRLGRESAGASLVLTMTLSLS